MPINSAQRLALLAPSPDLIAPVAPFVAQDMSIDFDGASEALSNQTDQVLGIANEWSAGCWHKANGEVGTNIIWDCDPVDTGPSASRLNLHQSVNDFNMLVRNTGAATPAVQYQWSNILVGGAWQYIVVTWDGTASPKVRFYLDGVDQGVPDIGDPDAAITMADDLRMVAVGNNANLGNNGALGRILYLSLHRVALSQPSIAEIFNSGVGGAFDLNANSGNYAEAGDLAHWWPVGKRASPNLGEDIAAAGFTPTINIETNAVGITDADRVADVPT